MKKDNDNIESFIKKDLKNYINNNKINLSDLIISNSEKCNLKNLIIEANFYKIKEEKNYENKNQIYQTIFEKTGNIEDIIRDFYRRYEGYSKKEEYQSSTGRTESQRQEGRDEKEQEKTQEKQEPKQPPLRSVRTVQEAFETLNLDSRASYEDAKKQFWKLAKSYHPDINPTGLEKFKQIANAWDLLEKHYKRR